MAAGQILVATRLHDLERPDGVPTTPLLTESDDRVCEEFFGNVANPGPVRRRVEREDSGEVLAVESLDERLEHITRMRVAIPVAVQGHAGEAIDEDAPSPNLYRLGQQETVLLLNLLPEHRPGRRDNPEAPRLFERAEIPAECRRIGYDPLGRDLERHDQSGLTVVVGTSVHELRAQGALAGSRTSGHDGDVAAGKPAEENGVQSRDPGPQEVTRHRRPPLLETTPL